MCSTAKALRKPVHRIGIGRIAQDFDSDVSRKRSKVRRIQRHNLVRVSHVHVQNGRIMEETCAISTEAFWSSRTLLPPRIVGTQKKTMIIATCMRDDLVTWTMRCKEGGVMGFDQTVYLYATIVQTLRLRFYNVVAALHGKDKTARRPAKPANGLSSHV